MPAEIERELARVVRARRVAPSDADGVVVTPAVAVDAAFLDAAGPQLRIVANYAVGLDNVDLDAARERGVVVSNTPGVLTNATAEHAIALVLALLRRIGEGDRSLRRRDRWEWGPDFMVGESLEGKEVLVVGPGTDRPPRRRARGRARRRDRPSPDATTTCSRCSPRPTS